MPLYTSNAIVLRRTNFGETDRIVTLYTREHGKVSGIAKGSRKPISRLAGSTEILTYGKYQLAGGRTLDIITQVDVKESFQKIHADLHRVAHAMYIAELTDKLVEEQESTPDIFDLLLSTLYLLQRPNDPEKITHMFELQFMTLMGYEPSLNICIRCGKTPTTRDLFFSPSLGGLVCRECGYLPEDAIQVSRDTIETMRSLLCAEAPETERLEIASDVMNQIARIMRWYIRYRVERELKSAAFLQSLRAENSP